MWQLLLYEWFVVSMSMQFVLKFVVDMLDLVELYHLMVFAAFSKQVLLGLHAGRRSLAGVSCSLRGSNSKPLKPGYSLGSS